MTHGELLTTTIPIRPGHFGQCNRPLKRLGEYLFIAGCSGRLVPRVVYYCDWCDLIYDVAFPDAGDPERVLTYFYSTAVHPRRVRP